MAIPNFILVPVLTSLAGLIIGGFGSWYWVSNVKEKEILSIKLDNTQKNLDNVHFYNQLLDQQIQEQAKLRISLKEVEDKHYAEIQSQKRSNEALRRDIADGKRRLQVLTTRKSCPPTEGTTPNVVNGNPYWADIHPRTAEDLIALVGEADRIRGQLIALQEWVKVSHANSD